MNATRTAAAAALAAGLAGTACSATPTPTAVITIAPVQAPAGRATATPSPTPKPEAKTTPSGDGTVDFLGRFTDSGDPKGTPVEFTIRYLNALRAGKWTAAVREMAAVERG